MASEHKPNGVVFWADISNGRGRTDALAWWLCAAKLKLFFAQA
jgi:hypothetical protein